MSVVFKKRRKLGHSHCQIIYYRIFQRVSKLFDTIDEASPLKVQGVKVKILRNIYDFFGKKKTARRNAKEENCHALRKGKEVTYLYRKT